MASKSMKGKSWTEDDLKQALEAVGNHSLSIRAAASLYNIPKSTLYDHHAGKSTASNPGPSPVLTDEDEKALVDWIIEMARIGYGRTRQQVFKTVKKILDRTGRPNPFVDNRPGKAWWYAFLKRHPQLAIRTPEPLQLSRLTACSEDALHKWYVDFDQFLKLNGIKMDPDVYQVTGNSKDQITTLCAINAAGNFIPPMHILPGHRFKYNPLEGGVPGAYLGRSDNGWMKTEVFYGWIANHFVDHIPPKRPVVLLVDGHSTHIDIEISEFCNAKSISLYSLPSHSSHITQPLDVGFYRPLKTAWKKAVAKYTSDNVGN